MLLVVALDLVWGRYFWNACPWIMERSQSLDFPYILLHRYTNDRRFGIIDHIFFIDEAYMQTLYLSQFFLSEILFLVRKKIQEKKRICFCSVDNIFYANL